MPDMLDVSLLDDLCVTARNPQSMLSPGETEALALLVKRLNLCVVAERHRDRTVAYAIADVVPDEQQSPVLSPILTVSARQLATDYRLSKAEQSRRNRAMLNACGNAYSLR